MILIVTISIALIRPTITISITEIRGVHVAFLREIFDCRDFLAHRSNTFISYVRDHTHQLSLTKEGERGERRKANKDGDR